MTREDREAEALRRRLYARSASAADVAAYLDRAGADGPPPPDPAPAPRDRRGLLAAGVVGAVALLVAGAVLSGAAAPRSARTTDAPSTAARWTSTPRNAVVAAGVVDGGARDEAGGTASPATATDTVYATARGDTAAGIAKRFGLCVADVLIALPYGFDPGLLPSGQHLLLHRSVSTDRRTGPC